MGTCGPLYCEDSIDMELNNMSTEYQEGWKPVSILVDSGASDSVAPSGFFPDIPVYETNASKANLMYTAAGGNKIRNEGMCMPKLYSENGKAYALSFQVAGVSKALGAVSRIVDAGNRVVFDDGCYTVNKATGDRTPIRIENGQFMIHVYVRKDGRKP